MPEPVCVPELPLLPPGEDPPEILQVCEGDVILTDTIQDRVAILNSPCFPARNGDTLSSVGGSPRGVAVDSNGFIYFNQAAVPEVLRIDLAFGGFDLDVVAPDPFSPSPFLFLEDLDLSPDGKRLFAADPGLVGKVWSIDTTAGEFVTGFADPNPSSGPFEPRIPQGLAFDPDDPNILYIADASPVFEGQIGTAAIWRVDLGADTPTASIILDSSIAGGANLLQKPYDLVVYDPTPGDPANQDDDVLLVTNTPLFAPPPGVAASPVRLFGIVDPASYSPIAGIRAADDVDDASDEITISGHGFSTGDGPMHLRVQGAGGALADLPSPLTPVTDYWVIATGADTIQLASSQTDASADNFIPITPGSGSFSLFTVANSFVILDDSDLDGPKGIALADEDELPAGAPDGFDDHLYVADSGGDEVRRYSIGGNGQSASDYGFVESFGGYDNPWGLAVVGELDPAPRDDFIVVNRDPNGAVSQLVRLRPDRLEQSFQDSNDPNSPRVFTNPIGTADLETIIWEGPDLIAPLDVCLDPDQPGAPPSLYTVTDGDPAGMASPDPDLIRVDATGTVPFGVPTGELGVPQRIVRDADGHYLVADVQKQAILKVLNDGSGTVETFLAHDPAADCADEACLLVPVGLDFDRDGILVVAQRNLLLSEGTPIDANDVEPLLRVVPRAQADGGPLVFRLPARGPPLGDPRDMVLDENGDALIVDRFNDIIFAGPGILRVSSVTGLLGWKNYASSFFDQISGIAIDANREILVTESGDDLDPSDPNFTRGGVLRIDPVSGTVTNLVDEFVQNDPAPASPDPVFLLFDTPDGIVRDEDLPPVAYTDDDEDGFGPSYDNCEPPQSDGGVSLCDTGPGCKNPDQSDVNGNGFGDVCERDDPDRDGLREFPFDPAEGLELFQDNCPQLPENKICPNSWDPQFCSVCAAYVPNGIWDSSEESGCYNPWQFNAQSQPDSNLDGIGDACQPLDPDGDGIPDDDNTLPGDPTQPNPDNPNDPNDRPDPPLCNGGSVACRDNCTENTQACRIEMGSLVCETLCLDDASCANSNQANTYDNGALEDPQDPNFVADTEGDACDDSDRDAQDFVIGDGVVDSLDNCPLDVNPTQEDWDGDLLGNVCDADADGDGFDDPGDSSIDNCDPNDPDPNVVCSDLGCANPTQEDWDGDGLGNVCDADDDGDGFDDPGDGSIDNCDPNDPDPNVVCSDLGCANPTQDDRDMDGLGDACDDSDGDGWADAADNCPDVANPAQADADTDGEGDFCDPDADPDGDGFVNALDNCDLQANADQTDTDGDGFGNRCDMDLVGNDNLVGVPDLGAFRSAFGTSDLEADGNGDGIVGVPDILIFVERFGTCAGDAAPFPGPCPATAP